MTSNGIWLSHRLLRSKAPSGMVAGDDACDGLQRLGALLPPQLGEAQRKDASKVLGPVALRLPEQTLRERLRKIQRSVPPPYYRVRRRLEARRDSYVAFGELQGNLDSNRFHCPERFAQPGMRHWSCGERAPYLGAFLPGVLAEWTERVPAAPPFKYCRTMRAAMLPSPVRRIREVAVLLPELHANINVGHQAKDVVFLSHVLAVQEALRGTAQHFNISTVLVEDTACATNTMLEKQGFLYRNATLHALVAGLDPPVHIAYLNQGANHRAAANSSSSHSLPDEPSIGRRAAHSVFGNEEPWQGAQAVCFDVVLQKGLAYAGDWRGADLLRRRVYAHCGIRANSPADSLLVVSHGAANNGHQTRRWFNDTHEWLIESLRARPFFVRGVCPKQDEERGHARSSSATENDAGRADCRPLRLVVRDMEGLSMCEQATLYARSKVVVVHHGASLANGLFLRKASLMVELNKQWESPKDAGLSPLRWAHTFDNAGYAAMFVSTGVAYIGARVTYGVWLSEPRGLAQGLAAMELRRNGRPRPRDINSGRVNSEGIVQWSAERMPRYVFWDPKMEVAINRTRWAVVLDEMDSMLGALAERGVASWAPEGDW